MLRASICFSCLCSEGKCWRCVHRTRKSTQSLTANMLGALGLSWEHGGAEEALKAAAKVPVSCLLTACKLIMPGCSFVPSLPPARKAEV